MPSIFSAFGGFSNVGVWAKYLGYGLVFLLVALCLTAVILMVLVKAKEKPVFIVDIISRRITKMGGRLKKTRSGQKAIYLPKLKKYLPQIQQEDKYQMGKNEAFIFLRDNNNFFHTARIPSILEYEEIMKGKIDKETDEERKKILKFNLLEVKDKIYLNPNPIEDLEWLADQTCQADSEFTKVWWKHPNIMVLGVAFICAIIFIMTLIISKKM